LFVYDFIFKGLFLLYEKASFHSNLFLTMGTPLLSSRAKPLVGDFSVPGDKSISHRALMLSSQVIGTTHITGLLEGEDVLHTADALRQMGVNIHRLGTGRWEVEGVGIGGLAESDNILEMGNSGTSTRLLMGLVTPYPFTSFFTGDASLRSRPMTRVTIPLEKMGAKTISRSKGRLPLALTGTSMPMPITYKLPVASAQVKSAIMLAGLNTSGITRVIEPEPTRDHTENMLRYLGYRVDRKTLEDGSIAISLQGHQELPSQDRELNVPGDPSSAAFLIVAALITPGSEITLHNICINPLRTGLFETLREMGARLEYVNLRKVAGEPVADIHVAYTERLRGIEVPAERAPSMIDEYPILAIAASFARGKSIMHGLGELRVKESDRLTAIIDGLMECKVKAWANGDSLYIEGSVSGAKGGGKIYTKLDHRIAMSFLVMGMASESPVEIDDAAAIATSFPGFVPLVNSMGAQIRAADGSSLQPKPARRKTDRGIYVPPMAIAIDGPAASGKGTLARRLAEHLGYAYLDTGSLYRAVGMKLIYADKDPNDKQAAIEAALNIDEEDFANPRLRQERIGQAASIVSAIPEVRQILLDYQRQFAHRPQGAVLDGRDIGTIVCPDAPVKIFMTASLESRARRRHRELQGQGIEVVYQSVFNELVERDKRDETRNAAPLIPAPDAVIIDTSEMDANTVFDQVLRLVESRAIARTPEQVG